MTTATARRTLTPWEGLRLLAPLARPGRSAFLLSAGLALLGTACQLLPHWAVADLLGRVVIGVWSPADVRRDALVALGGVMGMAALLGASTWMSHRAAFATLEELRLRIGRRLGEIPLGDLTRRRSGEVQRVLNDDVERLESFLAHAVPDLLSAGGVLVGTTVWLLVVDVRMGFAAIAVVLVALPLMIAGARIGADQTQAYGEVMARMNGSVVEFVRGIPVIRMFQRGDQAFAETATAIREATDFQAEWGRRLVLVYTVASTLLVSNVVVIAPAGLWAWSSGALSTRDLIFFFVVGLGYTSALTKLLQLVTQLGRLALGAALVSDLERTPVLPQVQGSASLGPASVELSDVHFSHTDLEGRRSPALRGVSMSIPRAPPPLWSGPAAQESPLSPP